MKVLDFGLAKLTERWRADEVDQDAATKAMVQTEPGVVMGTTAYMSPEQARGLWNRHAHRHLESGRRALRNDHRSRAFQK